MEYTVEIVDGERERERNTVTFDRNVSEPRSIFSKNTNRKQREETEKEREEKKKKERECAFVHGKR